MDKTITLLILFSLILAISALTASPTIGPNPIYSSAGTF